MIPIPSRTRTSPQFTNEAFSVNGAGDGVVFSAPAGGVTTENSKLPRSELREMNGGEKAAWTNTSGTHTLEVCQAITKVPPAKPEVVAAQIHDGNDDVVQIRLEDKTLIVQYDDGKSEVVIDPDYALGTPYHVRIVAGDRQGRGVLQRPAEGRAAALGLGLVLEGRRLRAVEHRHGRAMRALSARWSCTR